MEGEPRSSPDRVPHVCPIDFKMAAMEGEPRSSPDVLAVRPCHDPTIAPQWRGSREAPRTARSKT